jgi:hypothetical protein
MHHGTFCARTETTVMAIETTGIPLSDRAFGSVAALPRHPDQNRSKTAADRQRFLNAKRRYCVLKGRT